MRADVVAQSAEALIGNLARGVFFFLLFFFFLAFVWTRLVRRWGSERYAPLPPGPARQAGVVRNDSPAFWQTFGRLRLEFNQFIQRERDFSNRLRQCL